MHSGSGWRLGHRPALDGLRGIAILLVIAGHTALLPGVSGPTGVTVFFALSGFLITSLLLEEHTSTGRISWRRFYTRRARRLGPALAAYLGISAALTIAGVWWWNFPLYEYLPPLLYIQNWQMVIAGGAPHVTSITWSLSIEEQFYLLWPLAFLLARRWRPALWVIATAGVVTAIVLRLILWDGGAGQWRIYYGTDTRMDCLLLGCLLALATHRYSPKLPSWAWIPGAAVAGSVYAIGADVHLWLPVIVGAGTCLTIAATLSGGAQWLAWSPLRWFGRRSYALYLWHYPLVYMLARENHVIPMWLAVTASLTLAEASWWLVERPFKAKRQASGCVTVPAVSSTVPPETHDTEEKFMSAPDVPTVPSNTAAPVESATRK